MITEFELINDILKAFTLNRKDLLNLASYERDLIYDSFDMYKKDYLEMLLYKAKNTYHKISKEEVPQYAYRFQRKDNKDAKNKN